jgi:hypothetical protein
MEENRNFILKNVNLSIDSTNDRLTMRSYESLFSENRQPIIQQHVLKSMIVCQIQKLGRVTEIVRYYF